MFESNIFNCENFSHNLPQIIKIKCSKGGSKWNVRFEGLQDWRSVSVNIPYIRLARDYVSCYRFPRQGYACIGSKRHRSCVKRGNGFCLANHEMGKSYWHRISHPTVRILSRRRRRRNILKLYGIPADPRMKYQLISILRRPFHPDYIRNLYFIKFFLEKNSSILPRFSSFLILFEKVESQSSRIERESLVVFREIVQGFLSFWKDEVKSFFKKDRFWQDFFQNYFETHSNTDPRFLALAKNYLIENIQKLLYKKNIFDTF